MPVLVVDDNDEIRSVVREALEEEGFRVVTAADGRQALAHVEAARPSLLLLDMAMPVLDGWGVARELDQRGVRVPIVVMTAATNARKCAEEVGAQGFLGKPFDLDALIDAVHRLRIPRDEPAAGRWE